MMASYLECPLTSICHSVNLGLDWDTSRFRVYTTRERSYPHVDLQEARGTLEE